MKLFLLLLLVMVAAFLYAGGGSHTITAENWSAPSPSIQQKLKKPPVQGAVSGVGKIPLSDGELTPVASYDITARVLSRKSYFWDKESGVAPLDLALGWGDMAAYSNISQLSIHQGNRFYFYRWEADGPPIDSSVIQTSSANTHIIPANDDIKRKVNRVKPGQIIRLQGYLVNYYEGSPSGRWWAWNGSLTRADTGAGACELMYVTKADVY